MAPLTLFVTGAASGIGAHLVGRLLSAGHRVVAADVNDEALAKRAQSAGWAESRRLLVHLDVRKEEDWEKAYERAESTFGPMDIHLNVAGVLLPGYTHELKVEHIDFMLEVNVKGLMLGTRTAAKRMALRHRGHIINIGSLCSLAPVPGLTVYSASKFAVRGFTLAAAEDLRPLGIHVSLVMPDAVATPMLKLQENYDEAAIAFSGNAPLQVEDIAHVVLDEVIPKRPLEVVIPDGRGVLARAVNTAPRVVGLLAPFFRTRGQKNLDRIRQKRVDG